ncbi:MAG: hypothetical protein E7339_02645 [Clostridiales bacterium]|nr:hypothetical protein [Clostridiales bacterium]
MRKLLSKLLAMSLALVLVFTFFACTGTDSTGSEDGPAEVVWDEEEDDLKGITETEIWVGNSAGTTGLLAGIGVPFNLGIEAAFAAYNAKGGFNGRSVKLKHYDDGGLADQAATFMDKLIHEDEVFAIVGNFGSYAVDVNLDTLIDEEVPMVYAAAGNNALLNEDAKTLGEKGIFPVQPLNQTEGRMLILRAFAPTDKGGLGATKVGVIYNSVEASESLYRGIEAEMANLPAAQKNNIVVQKVAGEDYSAAVNALKAQGCDTVILTVIGANFTTALTTMANSAYFCKVLTSYNNASAAVFNDANNLLAEQYTSVFSTMAIFAQAWLDISSLTYVYNKADSPLLAAYKYLDTILGTNNYANGVPGFNEEYWGVAENIYSYALTVDPTTAFAMSYDSYALAGYIAGDLFCQGLAELQAQEKALSRANFVNIMETKSYKIALADYLSFADGMRSGVQSFALTSIYDVYNLNAELGGGVYHAASSATVYGLTSMAQYREILAGNAQ